MNNAEIANLLNLAAHALMGGIPLTDTSKEQLVKNLLFASLTLSQEEPEPAPDAPPRPYSHTQTRGMTADVPQKRCKSCGGIFPLHTPDCSKR